MDQTKTVHEKLYRTLQSTATHSYLQPQPVPFTKDTRYLNHLQVMINSSLLGSTMTPLCRKKEIPGSLIWLWRKKGPCLVLVSSIPISSTTTSAGSTEIWLEEQNRLYHPSRTAGKTKALMLPFFSIKVFDVSFSFSFFSSHFLSFLFQ